MLFCADNRKALQEKGIPFKEIGSTLGKQWREIDVETKKKYTEMARADKQRYAREMKAAQRQEARAMMKAAGNTKSKNTSGDSDDSSVQTASIFVNKKRSTPKAGEKAKNLSGVPPNPFSIGVNKSRTPEKTNPFAVKTNPFAKNEEQANATPQKKARRKQGEDSPPEDASPAKKLKLTRPVLKRNTSFAKEAREQTSSKFNIEENKE